MTPPSAALALEIGMQVHSELLGSLEVDPGELIGFPQGLFGFPECRSFVLISTEREGVYWLQSVEHSALAFLLVDPFLHFDGYSVEIAPADLAELHSGENGNVVILAIVTLPQTRDERPTANLQGPLAFNLNARVAKQLACAETKFGTRAPFDLLAGARE